MNYWLFKSEPDEYSIDDLANEPSGIGRWDGIRNYQARNNLRDQVSEGDLFFFYHSSCKVPGVAGIGKVVKAAYPDPAQFDAGSHYYDAKSSAKNPRWFCVDVAFVERFSDVVTLKTLKTIDGLSDMVLLKQGRLSVQPVLEAEWDFITRLAKSRY
jgi:predicted RNA-binding protein with PUA-like domain